MLSANASLPDEDATLALGAALSGCLAPGLVIYLQGDLGAGKTTLVRGVLRGLGYRGRVKSPTYTLVELYTISRLDLHHFDFYRFHDPREWIDAGFREAFNGEAIALIEWPDKAGSLLPPADVEATLEPAPAGRIASFTAGSAKGERCLACLASRYPSLTAR